MNKDNAHLVPIDLHHRVFVAMHVDWKRPISGFNRNPSCMSTSRVKRDRAWTGTALQANSACLIQLAVLAVDALLRTRVLIPRDLTG